MHTHRCVHGYDSAPPTANKRVAESLGGGMNQGLGARLLESSGSVKLRPRTIA